MFHVYFALYQLVLVCVVFRRTAGFRRFKTVDLVKEAGWTSGSGEIEFETWQAAKFQKFSKYTEVLEVCLDKHIIVDVSVVLFFSTECD